MRKFFAAGILFLTFVAPALAYEVSATSTNTFSLQGITNGIGSTAAATQEIQNGYQWLDGWTYHTFGFHVASIVVGILQLYSWALGAVKGSVDWVLSIVH